MNISAPHSLEDLILTTLSSGPLPIVNLIQQIRDRRPGTTKQGVYAVIRKLKKNEIVVVHRKSVSINNIWLKAMEEFLTRARHNTKTSTFGGGDFLNLRQGEKLQYFFRNPILTDSFWSHAFLTLVETSSPQKPILIYNPHEWFLLARTKNETDLFDYITNRGQELAIMIGGNTPLDRLARRYIDHPLKMYDTLSKPLFSKTNYYLNVIGDFVIEVWLDKSMSAQLDKFYSETTSFDDAAKDKLERILAQKGKNKFSISHNKRKADALRTKFSKRFFFKGNKDTQ